METEKIKVSQFTEAAGFLLFALESPPKFLLMRHADRWDLPKGHAESDESVLHTALRETEEETGVAANNIAVDADFRYVIEYEVNSSKRGRYGKRVTYFLGYLPAVRPIRLTEHIGYLWWTWPQPESIQASTIDPLLDAVGKHFTRFPQRLK